MDQTIAGFPRSVQMHVAAYQDAVERWQQRDPDRFRPELRDAGIAAVTALDALVSSLEAAADELRQQVAVYDVVAKGVV